MRSASPLLCLAIFVALSAGAFAVVPAHGQPTSSDQHAQASDRGERPSRADRVCCRRNWQNWWTTSQYCNDTAGGRQVANRECRNNWNDRWDNRWWGWDGASWNTRVCCRRGATDKWTIARDCRDSAGFPTATRFCSRAF